MIAHELVLWRSAVIKFRCPGSTTSQALSFYSMKKIKLIVLLLLALNLLACKVKRCASFEGNDKEYKMKYDRKGHVKK